MRAPDLKEKLEESEKLIQEISVTWEEKLRKTEQVHKVAPSLEECYVESLVYIFVMMLLECTILYVFATLLSFTNIQNGNLF